MNAKAIAITSAVVLATLGVIAVIVLYPAAVIYFLLSLAVAAAARPLVDRLVRRGLPRGLSVLLTYLSILAIVAVIAWFVTGPLFGEIQRLGDRLAVTYDRIWALWPNGTPLQRAVIARLPPPEMLYQAITGEQGQALAQNFLGWTTNLLAALSQVFAVLVLSIYWTIDQVYFERLWLSLLPVNVRARAREIGRMIESDIGAYIRSELLQSLLAGLLLGLAFRWMGLTYPIMTAFLAAFVWLIPWLGAVLAVLAALLSGLTSQGWLMGAGAALLTAAVLLFLELVIEPRILNHRRYNTSWLVILFLMALGDTLGLVGVIIAPPLATATLIVFRRILQPPVTPAIPATGLESARQIARLEERILSIRQIIEEMEKKPTQQTANMLDRLDELVSKANRMIEETSPQKTSQS